MIEFDRVNRSRVIARESGTRFETTVEGGRELREVRESDERESMKESVHDAFVYSLMYRCYECVVVWGCWLNVRV